MDLNNSQLCAILVLIYYHVVQAVLENTLRSFSALTKGKYRPRRVRVASVLSHCTVTAGETIRITYNRKIYDIDVVDVKPRDHGSRPRTAFARAASRSHRQRTNARAVQLSLRQRFVAAPEFSDTRARRTRMPPSDSGA